MTVLQIGVLAAVAAGLGRLVKARALAILGTSALAIFWLQPAQSPAWLGFWIPTATLGLCLLVWALTAPIEARQWRHNWAAAMTMAAAILLADVNRYFGLRSIYIVDTPRLRYALAGVALILAVTVLLALRRRPMRALSVVAFAAIVLVLVVLKLPNAATKLLEASALNPGFGTAGSSTSAGTLTMTTGIQWLGFSYLAFRLLHTILERRSGRLPALNLAEFASYALFFPSFTSGPIDRAERFLTDLRLPLSMTPDAWLEAGGRILIGMFKKFVVADSLAVISINQTLASNISSGGWLWLLLYAYALRIFFDFSGYTDIAIGMGRLMGIQLPENFAAPYLKPNITMFWNSWHITLTQWCRSYFFNPLVRALRAPSRPVQVWLVVLIAQLGTMLLIGMWHGIAWSFAAWGVWHGIGLFVHNRWISLVGNRIPAWARSGSGERILHGAGIALTFNFVTLGWLFFSFSSPGAAWSVLLRLFGAV